MQLDLRLGLLIAAILAFLFVVISIAKRKLNIKYSIIWMLWGLFIVVIAAFPDLFYLISDAMGIEIPVHTAFLMMIALLYGLVFFVYIMISKHNNEIIKLTYEVASLKKEVEDLKKK